MNNINYLILLLFLVGCNEVKPQRKAHKDLCIYQCTQRVLYPLDEVDGSAVTQIESICIKKFMHRECCESVYQKDYYVTCRRD